MYFPRNIIQIPFKPGPDYITIGLIETRLKQLALYYDKIDVPMLRTERFSIGPTGRLLRNEGYLVQTKIYLPSDEGKKWLPEHVPDPNDPNDGELAISHVGEISEIKSGFNNLLGPQGIDARALASLMQLYSFNQWESAEPGLWALSEGIYSPQPARKVQEWLLDYSRKSNIPILTSRSQYEIYKIIPELKSDTNVPAARTLELEIYNSIPTPDPDTEIYDILEFKLKRKDELDTFRNVVEELASQIASDPDPARAKIKSKEEIQHAILDIHNTMSESKIKSILNSLKIEISGSDIVQAAGSLSAAAVAFNQGLHEVAAVIAASTSIKSVGSMIKAEIKNIRTPEAAISRESRPFLYAWRSLDKFKIK